MIKRTPAIVLSLFCFCAGFFLPHCGGSEQPPVSTVAAPTTEESTTTAPATTTSPTTTAPAPATTAPVPPAMLELTSFDATPPAAGWTRPALGETRNDPIHGTDVRRVSSADGTRFNRNTYSRRQAENADGTMFFTYHGEAEYRVYDRVSLDLVRVLDIHPDAEPQWHPTNPNVVRSIAGPNSYVGDLRWYETAVDTGVTTVIADLTDRILDRFPTALYMQDRAEGSPSMDGNRIAWVVFDDREDPVGIVSYDLATNELIGAIDLADFGDDSPLDWVSMSPTGTYVMAGHWDATLVYDADLTNSRRVNNKGDHSDIALSAAGTDTYVYIDFSADTDGGWLVAVDLATLERTRLVDLYDNANTSIHISGKGYDRPGWVVVSTYSCKEPGAWSCEKVMLVDISATGRIYDLAHTYNCGDDYWTETHAVVNRTFTRVYFNSDAGSCGTNAEVYELTLPALPLLRD